MRSRRVVVLTLLTLFVVAAGLMIGAMRQESATVDETVILGSGYSYWLGHRYRLYPESPPLAQLLAAMPLTMRGTKLSPFGTAVVTGRLLAEPGTRWDLWVGDKPVRTTELFPHGPGFYHYPFDEQNAFGEDLIYGGQNDAEKLLFWGRIPEVMLTLLTGLLVFLWARGLQGDGPGLLAAAMFMLNPVILAYGHIVQTDIGMTLTFAMAVWMFARLLESPSIRGAVWAGLAVGLTLATKYTAIILGPTFLVLWLLARHRHRGARPLGWKNVLAVVGVAYGTTLLIYIPHWMPPPPIDATSADTLAVPTWFLKIRPILIPAGFFKGLALTLLHASNSNAAYLSGTWSPHGWWYYFPLAFAMKSPLPFLLFAGAGIALAVGLRRDLPFTELAAWAGAAVYLVCAMSGNANIGVRHILPIYPLLAVGAGCALGRWATQLPAARRKLAGYGGAALATASLVSVLLAYPFFISYLNPLAGGTERGYERLLDSNYDWGQDVIRLKKFLDARGIDRIHVNYFGTQAALEYYRIPNDFVGSEDAQRIQEGYLVISAHVLMRPEWTWLRDSRQPIARVGTTLFLYQMGSKP